MSSRTKKKDQKGHKSSAPARPSGWSDWEYYEAYGCDVRSRVKPDGELEYDYNNTQPADVALNDVPRTPGPLTEPGSNARGEEAFDAEDDPANLSDDQPIDPLYGYARQSTTTNPYARSSTTSNPYARSSTTSNLAYGLSRIQISQEEEYDDDEEQEEEEEDQIDMSSPYDFCVNEKQAFFKLKEGQTPSQTMPSQYTAPEARLKSGEARYQCLIPACAEKNTMFKKHRELYDHFRKEHKKRRPADKQRYKPTTDGRSFPGSYAASPPSAYAASPPTAYTASPPSAYPASPLAGSSSINRPESNGSIRHISIKAASASTVLHKDFKVHHSKNFKFGHIFKIVWVEPMGQTGKGPRSIQTIDSEIKSKFGEQGYVSIRRFIIIREQEGHSICLPILTYGNRGTTKPGVKSSHHAIIYMEDSGAKHRKDRFVPKEAPGEQLLPNTPICVRRKNLSDKLDHLSRLNYAKVYTVEHNVKVSFIGRVSESSKPSLISDYNKINQLLYEAPMLTEEAE